MNPNLTQRRRGAEKERRGHGRLDRERHSTVIAARPHDSMVGSARRGRPKPQARMRRPRVPRNKVEFACSKPRSAVLANLRFSIIHRLATSRAEFKLMSSLSFQPMEAKKTRPIWEPRNLAEYAKKRVAVDTGCMESLDGLDHQLLTGDLRRISEQAFLGPSLVYGCESVDAGGRFRERCAHFFDLKENPSASLLLLGRRHRIFT